MAERAVGVPCAAVHPARAGAIPSCHCCRPAFRLHPPQGRTDMFLYRCSNPGLSFLPRVVDQLPNAAADGACGSLCSSCSSGRASLRH